jgi:endonuclease YncB( thermonuclease family)
MLGTTLSTPHTRARAPRRVSLALALALLAACAAPAGALEGKVVRIHDGDTLTVLVGKERVRVRLACIDAPEHGQPFASRARQALADLAHLRRVTVEVVDRDDYGRTVGRVKVGGTDVNLALVRAGMAWHYAYHCPDARDLAQAQREAREARRGLWADPHPVEPSRWRRTQKKSPGSGVRETETLFPVRHSAVCVACPLTGTGCRRHTFSAYSRIARSDEK